MSLKFLEVLFNVFYYILSNSINKTCNNDYNSSLIIHIAIRILISWLLDDIVDFHFNRIQNLNSQKLFSIQISIVV